MDCISQERLRTEDEVAQQLNATVRRLRHWRTVGKGPRYLKIGQSVQYRPRDVEEWLNEQVIDP